MMIGGHTNHIPGIGERCLPGGPPYGGQDGIIHLTSDTEVTIRALSGISRPMVLPAGTTLTQAPLAAVLRYTAHMVVPAVLPPTTRGQEHMRAAERSTVLTGALV